MCDSNHMGASRVARGIGVADARRGAASVARLRGLKEGCGGVVPPANAGGKRLPPLRG